MGGALKCESIKWGKKRKVLHNEERYAVAPRDIIRPKKANHWT